MENYKSISNNRSSRIWIGLLILTIGIVFFLRNFGVYIPNWIISWHTYLIIVGLFIGFRRNFNGGLWLAIVLIGAYFTLEDITDFSFRGYFFPSAFIILGIYLILKPKKEISAAWKKDKYKHENSSLEKELLLEDSKLDENDIVDSVNVFGGAHHKIYSKNFKGGDVTAIFGGCELNLIQADFQGKIVIDVLTIFGGAKLILPSTWEVKSEVVAIFGGMDDKRSVAPFGDEPKKILVIKGVALFGGVEIKNF